MATNKPRITITLEERAYDILSRMSAVSGQSMSSIVTEFLDTALPAMDRIATALEQVKKMPEEAKAGLRAAIERAEADLIPKAQAALDQADLGFDLIAQASQKPARKAARKAASPAPRKAEKRLSTPVPVTRGSGHPSAKKTPAKKGAR